MHYLYISIRVILLAILFLAISYAEASSVLSAQSVPTTYHHGKSINTHQQWVNYYQKELGQYGRVYQLPARRGESFNLRCPNKSVQRLHFVTNTATHQGYYPKIRLTYYNQSGNVLAVYTSSSTEIVQMGGQHTFLQMKVKTIPRQSHRATLTVLEGEGTVLTAFE